MNKTEEYINLDWASAVSLASENNLRFQIAELDGVPQLSTADLRDDRIKVIIEGGRVIDAWIG